MSNFIGLSPNKPYIVGLLVPTVFYYISCVVCNYYLGILGKNILLSFLKYADKIKFVCIHKLNFFINNNILEGGIRTNFVFAGNLWFCALTVS